MIETDAPPRARAPADESIRSLFGETVDHTKAYLTAEKQALTLRAKLIAAVAKTVAIFGTVAAVLALFALGWLLVALVAMLAYLIPYPLAALAMGLILLLAAYLCVRRILSAIRSLPGANS